jgi:tyrosyl-tRNA synthetase
MWNYYELLSSLSIEEINKLKTSVEKGKVHPKDTKEKLALEIIERYYDADAAKDAKRHFDQVIVGKGVPDDVKTVKKNIVEMRDLSIVDVIFGLEMAESKGQARRLIAQGGVKVNDEKIMDPFYKFPIGIHTLRVGKRKIIRVIVD